MKRIVNWLILLSLIAACAGCATVAEWFGVAGDIVTDPKVQEHAGGVVANVIAGNWFGAATSLGELVFAGGAIYKSVMMRREGLRAKRGEATAKEPGGGADPQVVAAVLAQIHPKVGV